MDVNTELNADFFIKFDNLIDSNLNQIIVDIKKILQIIFQYHQIVMSCKITWIMQQRNLSLKLQKNKVFLKLI